MEQDVKVLLDQISTTLIDLKAKVDSMTSDAPTFIDNEFFELNSKDTFVKLKANAFGINKVQFSFVKFDVNTKKLTSSMDAYLDMEDALLFANDILSGKIAKLAEIEKTKGAKYPGKVWESSMGGVHEQKAAQRGRIDGKAISRMFTLSPGMSQPFIFTAEQRPGTTNDRGLIVPEYSAKPEVQIRVPATAESIKKMALAIQSHITAYRAAQYANGAYNVDPAKRTTN